LVLRISSLPSLDEDLAQVRAVDRQVAGRAVGGLGIERAVPLGKLDGVAAEAQIGDARRRQHVAVRRSVDVVTGRAALQPGRAVLEEEGAALVGVALQAGFLLETAQSAERGGLMRVVAGRALKDALLQAMALVQGELGEDVLVAGGTALGCADLAPAWGFAAWTLWQVVQSREALPWGPARNWAFEAEWQARHCLFFRAAESAALKARIGAPPLSFTCASEPK